MPGALGIFGVHRPERVVEAAIRKLCVLPHSQAQRFAVDSRVMLAAVSRGNRSRRDLAGFARDEHGAVLLYGSAFRQSPHPHAIDAAELLQPVRERRVVEALSDCDGGYCVVAADTERGEVTLFSDRLGSQPIYFAATPDGLAFGPEAKAVLTLTGLEPRYARAGLIGFLGLGYNIATQTLFEGVSYLEPGTVLRYDLGTRRHAVARYWALGFAADPPLRRRADAEEALRDAILRSHRLLLSDDPPAHQVLLSGGYDSRGILAALCRIGAPPTEAIAWGVERCARWSDAYIAERLARSRGVPFRLLACDAASMLDNATEWAFVSELATDNIGWFGEGVHSLRDFYSATSGVSFVGDEVWGSGPRLAGDAQARAATLPSSYSQIVSELLTLRAAAEARETYEAMLRHVMAPCATPERTGDYRDFIYVHARTARFIMALGYHKEHATELRRPFLTREVLDVVSKLPERLRVFKNAYCTMLTRFFPEVMQLPVNVVSSLPRWRNAIRSDPRLAALYRGLLRWSELEAGPLADLVDRSSFERLRDAFFAPWTGGGPRPNPLRVEAQAALLAAVNRSRLLACANTARKSLLLSKNVPDETTRFAVLHRIAALVLLQRQLAALGRA